MKFRLVEDTINDYRSEDNDKIFDFADKYKIKDSIISNYIKSMADDLSKIRPANGSSTQQVLLKQKEQNKSYIEVAKDIFLYTLTKDEKSLANKIRVLPHFSHSTIVNDWITDQWKIVWKERREKERKEQEEQAKKKHK